MMAELVHVKFTFNRSTLHLQALAHGVPLDVQI